jgi:hypothetical protein
MSKSPTDEKYSAEETAQRFHAALRGARLAGSQHVKSVIPKRTKPQQKKRKTKGR